MAAIVKPGGRRATILWGAIGIGVWGALYYALSDTLVMTAFYPSPMGSYANLYTTNNTWLASQNGSVVIGQKTQTPKAELDVEGSNPGGLMYVGGLATVNGTAQTINDGEIIAGGGVQPGPTTAACTASNNGMIAITTCGGQANAACYCNGAQSQWQPLGGGLPSGLTSASGSNPSCPSDYPNPIAMYWNSATNSCCTTNGGWAGTSGPTPCSRSYSTCTWSCCYPGSWCDCGTPTGNQHVYGYQCYQYGTGSCTGPTLNAYTQIICHS